MPIKHPCQKGLCLGNLRALCFIGRSMRGARAQRIDGGLRCSLHRLPVFHGGSHVAQHAHQAVVQRLQPLRLRETIDLDVDIRLVVRVAIRVVVGVGWRVTRECGRPQHAAGFYRRAGARSIAPHAVDGVESGMER